MDAGRREQARNRTLRIDLLHGALAISKDLFHNRYMKSAYELAMERLNKTAPAAKVTDKQKKHLAELDSKYAAKIAERELFIKGELGKAMAAGEYDEVEKLEKQIVSERKSLQVELEEKKEKVRGTK